MNALKQIARFIYNVITIAIVIILVFALYCMAQRYIMNKEYADVFGYTFFQIQTGSMAGAIEVDDIIIVKITDDVHENDIISFMNEEAVITHRIIQENGDSYITKGDANNTEDKPIEKKQIIGKVVKILPKFGVWFAVFSDWKVIGSIVVTMLIIGNVVSDDDKEEEEKKRKHTLAKGIKNFLKHVFKKHYDT